MIPPQIHVNTDYNDYIPDEVFFEFICDTMDESWQCLNFIWNWCKENEIQYRVDSFQSNQMRMQVWNKEHRAMMRLTFTLIKSMIDDDEFGAIAHF